MMLLRLGKFVCKHLTQTVHSYSVALKTGSFIFIPGGPMHQTIINHEPVAPGCREAIKVKCHAQ